MASYPTAIDQRSILVGATETDTVTPCLVVGPKLLASFRCLAIFYGIFQTWSATILWKRVDSVFDNAMSG